MPPSFFVFPDIIPPHHPFVNGNFKKNPQFPAHFRTFKLHFLLSFAGYLLVIALPERRNAAASSDETLPELDELPKL